VTVIPSVTDEQLLAMREEYEMAEFELDRAVFVDGIGDLDFELQRQEVERLRARYLAVLSQRPDRRPFSGRRA
jgi:predicted translin family RNA/ssDNA-binding protein